MCVCVCVCMCVCADVHIANLVAIRYMLFHEYMEQLELAQRM